MSQFFKTEREKLDFMAELEMVDEDEFREEIDQLEAKNAKQDIEIDGLRRQVNILLELNGKRPIKKEV